MRRASPKALKNKEPKPPKNKRRSPYDLSEIAFTDRLCAALLSSYAGASAQNPGQQRKKDLALEIRHCFHDPTSELERIPWQVEDMMQTLENLWKSPVSIDKAIGSLLASHWEPLEPETRDYIANAWDRRRQPLSKFTADFSRRYKFVRSIGRVKTLLRKKGLSPGKADDVIAQALGLSSGNTLRQQLLRASK